MNIMRNVLSKITVGLLSCMMLLSCDRHRNMPGYDFMPDMVYSQAYDAYSENPVFRDSLTNQLPVYGTMPRGQVAFRYNVFPENRLFAGQTLLSRDQMVMKSVFEGKKLYTTFCVNCHGESGKGEGFLVTSKKLPVTVKVGDLTQERLVKASRGELFHVVTVGYGMMGSYGAALSELDRWKIIEYVKVKLQGQELGARTLSGANPALSEPYADFEARIASDFSRTNGVGPASPLTFGAINQAWVTEGEALFKLKCSSCHKPTRKYVGPAPKGVLSRRNPQWIMNMILDPEIMVKEDPVAKELLTRYLAPMANQSLTEDEARKILEFFRTLE
jgi:mono/diheme cytochrome c family protein